MTKKMILMLAAVIPITPSSAMTPSKTSGYWLARWGTRKKLMPWQSWTETLLSIGATSDNWGRGQYGYDSKYQGVDTNHLYQHRRLRLWPVILPIWLNKNKKVNENKLYITAFTNQCFKCSNIHNLTKWLHITYTRIPICYQYHTIHVWSISTYCKIVLQWPWHNKYSN